MNHSSIGDENETSAGNYFLLDPVFTADKASSKSKRAVCGDGDEENESTGESSSLDPVKTDEDKPAVKIADESPSVSSYVMQVPPFAGALAMIRLKRN